MMLFFLVPPEVLPAAAREPGKPPRLLLLLLPLLLLLLLLLLLMLLLLLLLLPLLLLLLLLAVLMLSPLLRRAVSLPPLRSLVGGHPPPVEAGQPRQHQKKIFPGPAAAPIAASVPIAASAAAAAAYTPASAGVPPGCGRGHGGHDRVEAKVEVAQARKIGQPADLAHVLHPVLPQNQRRERRQVLHSLRSAGEERGGRGMREREGEREKKTEKPLKVDQTQLKTRLLQQQPRGREAVRFTRPWEKKKA